MNRAIVVGAGVVGATAALALCERGLQVTLIDAGSEPATGTSAQNGGQLSYSDNGVVNTPDIFSQMPGLMLGLNPAFRFRLGVSRHNLNWLLRFVRASLPTQSKRHFSAVQKMAVASRQAMTQWLDTYDWQFNRRVSRKLYLIENSASLHHYDKNIALTNQLGGNQQRISRSQALELEPQLKDVQFNIAGAIYTPEDEVGDAALFSQEAVATAEKNFGLKIKYNTKVTSLIIKNGRCQGVQTDKEEITADYVVICAGHESPGLVKETGIKLPIVPMTGYSLSIPATSQVPDLSLSDGAHRIVLCRLGDRLRVAGMADLGWLPDSIPEQRINQLRKTLRDRFPTFADYDADDQPWMGHRPQSPTSEPFVGLTKVKGLALNTGHGMLGWTLAAGSAQKLCDEMGLGKIPNVGRKRTEMAHV